MDIFTKNNNKKPLFWSLKQRKMEYANVKEQIKYMESISKKPPILVIDACIAIEPGQNKTKKLQKKTP